MNLKKILIILSTIISINLMANDIILTGVVTKIITPDVESSIVKDYCITFIKDSYGNSFAILEDYFICDLALKYNIGDKMQEVIDSDLIVPAEKLESRIQTQLYQLDKNTNFLLLDYE